MDTQEASGRKQLPAQVGIGAQVTVELIDAQGHRDPMTVRLVEEGAGDLAQDLLGADTPLGRAIRAKFEGDEFDYAMGDVRRVRIAQVTPGQAAQAKTMARQAQSRRDAVLTKARAAAERTNAEMFAASFSGKWGDYDIDPPGQHEEDRI